MPDIEHPLVKALYGVEGKAEIINGQIVEPPLAGYWPAHAAGEILVSLRQHRIQTRTGHAGGSRLGFIVDLPHRMSFAPDASY